MRAKQDIPRHQRTDCPSPGLSRGTGAGTEPRRREAPLERTRKVKVLVFPQGQRTPRVVEVSCVVRGPASDETQELVLNALFGPRPAIASIPAGPELCAVHNAQNGQLYFAYDKNAQTRSLPSALLRAHDLEGPLVGYRAHTPDLDAPNKLVYADAEMRDAPTFTTALQYHPSPFIWVGDEDEGAAAAREDFRQSLAAMLAAATPYPFEDGPDLGPEPGSQGGRPAGRRGRKGRRAPGPGLQAVPQEVPLDTELAIRRVVREELRAQRPSLEKLVKELAEARAAECVVYIGGTIVAGYTVWDWVLSPLFRWCWPFFTTHLPWLVGRSFWWGLDTLWRLVQLYLLSIPVRYFWQRWQKSSRHV